MSAGGGTQAYRGRMDGNRAVVTCPDGSQLSPAPSLAVRNHSPTGFAWGYEGSGPAQLALAVLLDFNRDRTFATRHYQAFKREVVARWPVGEPWTLDVHDLDARSPQTRGNGPQERRSAPRTGNGAPKPPETPPEAPQRAHGRSWTPPASPPDDDLPF